LWENSPDMIVVQEVERLKAELDSLLPMNKEALEMLQKKIRLEFNYNSNHIEGNTLTYGETQLLLIYGKVSGDFDVRELEEMKAHDVAFAKISEWAQNKERDLTESDIKSLNELILVRPFWKEALTPDGQTTRREIKVGDYKEHPNSVRLQNGEMFHYASVLDTPIKMQELMSWYDSQKNSVHPLQLATEFHHRFVLIHPFDDGNGRIARLLVNYILLRYGYPPIVIKSEDKKNYLLALNKADTGDLPAFINYMGEQLKWSFDLYLSAAKGLDIEEEDDWRKKLVLLKKDENTITKRTSHNTFLFLSSIYSQFADQLLLHLENIFDGVFLTIEYSHKEVRAGNRTLHLSGLAEIEIKKQIATSGLLDVDNMQDLKTTFIFGDFCKNDYNSFDIAIDIILKLDKYDYRIHIEVPEPTIHNGIEEPIVKHQLEKAREQIGRLVMSKIESHLSSN